MVDQAGKGSKYRPVDQKKWDKGWEDAFGFKKKNNKKNLMQPGGVFDTTDIPQSKDKKGDNENE